MENNHGTKFKHMVIGHSQLKNMEKYKFEDQPDINFHIDFKSISGGKAPQLAKIIKEEIMLSPDPLRISAVIWQNSILDLSIQEMEDIVLDMEAFLRDYPSHRVAFPECQYVPKLERYWDKIAQLNTILNKYNLRQGFNSYPLHKTTMQYSKQKKSLVVRQSSYKEFNDALKKHGAGQVDDIGQLGYHIDEGAPKTRYAQHIRRFHKNGFNDMNPSARSYDQPKRSSTIFFGRNPVNKMKNPKAADARMVINKIRADKELEKRADSEDWAKKKQSTADKVQTPSFDVSYRAEEWLQYGNERGYINTLMQARGLKKAQVDNSPINNSDDKRSSEEEKRVKKRKKKTEEEKRKRKKVEEKRKRKKKAKKFESSSSSTSSSSTSSSSTSSEEEEKGKKKKKHKRN